MDTTYSSADICLDMQNNSALQALLRDVNENKYIAAKTACDMSADLNNHINIVNKTITDGDANLKDILTSQNLSLHNRLCDSEKSAITVGFQNQIELMKVQTALATQIAESKCANIEKIIESRYLNSKEFCELEHRLTSQLTENRFAAEKDADALGDKLSDCCCSIKEQAAAIQAAGIQDELNELRLEKAVRSYSYNSSGNNFGGGYGSQFVGGNVGQNYGVGNQTK